VTVIRAIVLARYGLNAHSHPGDIPVEKAVLLLGRARWTTPLTPPSRCGQATLTRSRTSPTHRLTSVGHLGVNIPGGRRHAAGPASTQVIHMVHSPYDDNDRVTCVIFSASHHLTPTWGRYRPGALRTPWLIKPGQLPPGALCRSLCGPWKHDPTHCASIAPARTIHDARPDRSNHT